jgi:serine protease
MGTSMASPHAAGVAALVVGEGVTDPAAVEKILQDTARKPANQTYNRDKYGAGIIDAPAAVKAARSKGGGLRLLLGLLMAGAVAASARKRGLGVSISGLGGLSYLGGVLIGATGLFFLPSIAPSLSSAPVVHALTSGLPLWLGNANPVWFSALIPLALIAVGYGVPRARAPLAGIAVGVAATLAFFAVVPMMSMAVPSAFGFATVWLLLNSVVCLGLARLALRR